MLALVLATTALAQVSARAGDSVSPTLARISQRGEILVGMSGDQPPLNMRNKKKEIIGLDADLARAIASGLSVKLRIVTKPFAELLPALAADELDLVISGVTITPERNMKAAFVGPYFTSGKSIITRTKALAKLKTVDEMNSSKFTLAALEGSTSQIFVQELTPKAKLKTAATLDEATALVRSGKADALVADLPYCVFAGATDKSGELDSLTEPLTFEPLGIALPPDDPLFVNLVQNILTTMAGTGALDALKHRWFGDNAWLEELQ